jgi:ABC-type transport system involved in multi-copper enzyme maturation permease subunit
VTLALVRSELLKVLSTRLWWGLLIGAVLYAMVQAGVTAGFAGVDPGAGQPATATLDQPDAIRGVYASSAFTGAYLFATILGITGMTGEHRYQTLTPTFLATPRRGLVVVAKGVAHTVVGIGYGVAALAGTLVAGGVVIAVRGYDLGYGTPGLWRAAALGILAVGLWTLVGLGIGTLVRNQVAAVLVGIFLIFLLEPLVSFGLSALDLDAVARWLPSNASAALTSPERTVLDYLDWWVGGLALLAYAAAFTGVGMLLTNRRDVT